jgi:hypothetical protein
LAKTLQCSRSPLGAPPTRLDALVDGEDVPVTQFYRLTAMRPGKAEGIMVMQGCEAEAAPDAVHETMNSKVATTVFFLLQGNNAWPTM